MRVAGRSNLLRQVRLLVGEERRWRWPVLLGLAIVVTAAEMLGAFLVFVLLAVVVDTDPATRLPLIGELTSWFPQATGEQLQVGLALTVAVFFVVRFGVIAGVAYVQNRLIDNAAALVADRLLRGYLAMPYQEHTRRSSSELVRNTFATTQELARNALRPLVRIGSEGLVVVGILVVLLLVSLPATLLAAAVLGPTVWVLQRWLQPRLERLGAEAQEASTQTISAVQQAVGGIRDLKVLGRQGRFADRHRHHRLALARAHHLRETLFVLPRALIETSLVVVIVAVFVPALLGDAEVAEVLSTLGLFAYAGLRLQPPLQKVVESVNALRFSTRGLADLVRDQQLVEPWLRQATGAAADDGPTLRDRIEVRGVGMEYDGESHPALREVDITIAAGEFVGICGPTGCGKSTLLDVIVGLLPPTSGEVRIDGRILQPEPWWWWRQIGLVSQDTFLIDDTLRRNIALGEDDDEVDPERLHRAVEQAQLTSVLEDLPVGLDTLVGERGIRLSGGQRQRVAVARALYREPAVLVLDEGTSALDRQTESLLVAAMDEARQDRTLIAVAHRIATVREADRILVMSGGRVVDEGTYAHLSRTSALFRSLDH